MTKRRNIITIIVIIIVITVIIGMYFKTTFFRKELHFIHSNILNQYLYAWDKKLISQNMHVKTTVVGSPEALGPYLIGQNPADLVEVSTVFAGIAYSKNSKVKIVGSLTKGGNADSVLVVRKDSGIISSRDLKGKKVGTAGLAMTPTVLFRELLNQEYGIKYDQVNFVLKPLPILLNILDKRQLDAVIVFNIFAYQASLNPKFLVLMDIDEEAKNFLIGDYPIVALLASNEDTVAHRGWEIKQILGVIKESNKYALTHKDEVARNLALDFDLDIETYKKFAFKIQPANIYLTNKEKENILKILSIAYKQGLLEQRVGDEIFW